MKWCTRIAIHEHIGKTITDGEIIDISIVPDDHRFGVVEADGALELHFEADLKPLDSSIGVPVD